MFTPAIQRIVWKEFRAQRAVWIAIAVELVLMQFWWTVTQERFPLNVLSIAFVLTGIFAMTSSAMLFAGESEAQTDGFLRQLPFRSKDLLLGKLGYCIAAVVAFLAFAMLTTLMAGTVAGQFGLSSDSYLGDPVVYANGIVGLWAWGMFYSLVTRKVVWTVIGAACTELVVNGAIHGILAEYRLGDVPIFATYWVVTFMVILVDAWLLSKWYAGEAGARSSVLPISPAATAVPVASVQSLPWVRYYRLAGLTGKLSGVLLGLLAWFMLTGPVQPSAFSVLWIASPAILAAFVVVMAIHAISPQFMQDQLPVMSEQPLIRRTDAVGNLLRLGQKASLVGLNIAALLLGTVLSFCAIAFLVSLSYQDPYAPPLRPSERVTLLALAFGSGLVLWLGEQATCWMIGAERSGWLRLLQRSQAICRRFSKSYGSLLWIEARRAMPVLVIGWVLLGLCAFYSEGHPQSESTFSVLGFGLASLVCGLLTILPDRSHGSLSFLIERGVPARKVLGSKIAVWLTTLLLLSIFPLVSHSQFWTDIEVRSQTLSLMAGQIPPAGVELWLYSRACLIAFGIGAGLFTIGLLCAAWIRRPILAVIGGVTGAIVWSAWLGSLMSLNAWMSTTVVVPIALLVLGVFWTGTSTLLEQANWKAKLGRVGWVLFVFLLALQSLGRYRANEIPVVEIPEDIRNGKPTPQGLGNNIASSWNSTISTDFLDQLSEEGGLQNSLIQPQGFWGSENVFQLTIQRLKLDDENCDLDAAITHLTKWLKLTTLMSGRSRNEDGWVECLKTRRIVLSAIRRWANHPKQTAERIERALPGIGEAQSSSDTFAVNALAREYADARRALEEGDPMDRMSRASGIYRWYLSVSGEKERVRRLVDYYYYLSGNTHVSQDPSVGQEYDLWLRTTAPSAYALGVNLPYQRLATRHHGQMEMAFSATRATSLMLRLQAWRLKHGQFPNSLVNVLQEGELATDLLTMVDFGYEPQGLDLDLRVYRDRVVPAGQPILYSLGVNLPRGIGLQKRHGDSRHFYTTLNWVTEQHPNLTSEQLRETSRISLMGPVPNSSEAAANPIQLRFLILGQKADEDSLDLPPHGRDPAPNQDRGDGAASMSGGMGIGSSAGETEAELPPPIPGGESPAPLGATDAPPHLPTVPAEPTTPLPETPPQPPAAEPVGAKLL